MVGKIDLIMPRAGESLIKAVTEMAWVPVIKHYKGVCHTFVDASADIDMTLAIAENAKCQRPGVCNAMETLLVHKDVADAFLPRMIARFKELGVELRGDKTVQKFDASIKPATEEDWTTEYLDLILSIRIVKNVQVAIDHINTYGSKHSDAIVTTDAKAAKKFTLYIVLTVRLPAWCSLLSAKI